MAAEASDRNGKADNTLAHLPSCLALRCRPSSANNRDEKQGDTVARPAEQFRHSAGCHLMGRDVVQRRYDMPPTRGVPEKHGALHSHWGLDGTVEDGESRSYES